MKDHSRRAPDAKHIRAADAVLSEVTLAVKAREQVEAATGRHTEIEFGDPRQARRDALDVRLTWFMVGAIAASAWYLAVIKLSGWL